MKSYRLVRHVPAEEGYDLVVAGGGPAGSAAAVSAARLGAKVLLVEATGCLGGMGTSGLVTAFDPMSDGEKMIVGGFMREVIERMHARGFVPDYVTPDYWHKGWHLWTPFNSEGLKLLLDEFVKEAGIEVRFFTQVIDAEVSVRKKRVQGVIVSNIEGYRCLRAKTFVDATGDAALAHISGVRCTESGRDTPRIMPSTLCSLFAGIDWSRIEMGGWHGTGPQRIVPGRQQEMVEKAIAEGHFSEPDYHVPGMIRVGRTVGNLNAPHIFDLNALECKSLTEGMIKGRRLAQEYKEFYRKYLPGFEKVEHVATAALMGVRESRRIVGEYELNHEDYKARRHFADQIGLFNKSVDIHPYDGTMEGLRRHLNDDAEGIKPGESFGLPYGILVPKGWTNLWAAGRCNSSDVKVSVTIRVQPAAAMMGQAAGTAAVQSIRTGQPANLLNTAELVEALRKAGAYLPQKDLSETMTRA